MEIDENMFLSMQKIYLKILMNGTLRVIAVWESWFLNIFCGIIAVSLIEGGSGERCSSEVYLTRLDL